MSTNEKDVDPFDLAAGVPDVQGGLRPKPKSTDRISKRVIFVAMFIVLTVIVIFFVALDNMDNKRKASPPKTVLKVPDTIPFLPDDESSSLTGDSDKKRISLARAPEVVQRPVDVAKTTKGSVPEPSPDASSGVPTAPPPLTPEQQAKLQEKLDRLARDRKAMETGLQAKSFTIEDRPPALGANTLGNAAPDSLGIMNSLKGALQGAIPSAQAKPDGEQEQKQEFLRTAEKAKHGYHEHVALPPISRNEVKAGSFIPMALEQGINSDLPGKITARVTEDVYDTMTGCRLLIPAMSKVIGDYDSKVAIGQGRNLVVWNNMIFADGAELNLAGMQGYDTSGAAGLDADVDNHWFRLFGLAFGMSMVTATVQLSVPQPNPGATGAAAPQTPGQVIAASLAQQYGQLGAQILGKYMAVQPTLRNYPGERFVIMVPRTVVFRKVWRNRCTG